MKGLLAPPGVKGRASSRSLPQHGQQHWACVELNTKWGWRQPSQAPTPQLRAHLMGSKKLSKPLPLR